MKFAQNRLYIEAYDKCPNCGLLLYEEPSGGVNGAVTFEGKLFCSQWCVDWTVDRRRRRAEEAAGPASPSPGPALR